MDDRNNDKRRRLASGGILFIGVLLACLLMFPPTEGLSGSVVIRWVGAALLVAALALWIHLSFERQRFSEIRDQALESIGSGVIVYLIEPDGSYLYLTANHVFMDMAGLTEEEIRSRNPVALVQEMLGITSLEIREVREDIRKKGHCTRMERFTNLSTGKTIWAVVDDRVCVINGKTVNVTTIMDMDSVRHLPEDKRLDPLTGLLSKRAARIFISQSMETGGILCMLDVDDFKRFVAEHGEDEGNRAITAVTDVLNRSFRTRDIVSRVKGDRFMVLMETERITEDFVINKMGVIRERMGKIRILKGLTLSGGAVLIPVGGNISFEEAVNRAEEALAEAKNTGKNRLIIHGSENGAAVSEQGVGENTRNP